MDPSPLLLVGSFLVGWIARDWTVARCVVPEPQPCQCVCKLSGDPPHPTEVATSVQWILGGIGLLVLVVVFSNTALALKFTYQDSSTGANREVLVGVKGKSKGVYGASKGLPLTA